MNPLQPAITVIMASYNAEKYIKYAIDSIINQTMKNWELIIVDDNSSDNTYQIIQQYKDSRIKVYRNSKNEGPAFSRTFALHNASGEYIAVLDADDISLPKRLEIEYNYLQKHRDIDIVSSNFQNIDEDNRLINKRWGAKPKQLSPDEIFVRILFKCILLHSSVMMRASFLKENDLEYDTNYPCNQDYHLWSRAIFLGKIITLPNTLVQYRISPTQISNSKREKQLQLANKLRKDMFRKLKLNFGDNELDVFNKLENNDYSDPLLINNTLITLYNDIDSSKVNMHILKREILKFLCRNILISGFKFKFLKVLKEKLRLTPSDIFFVYKRFSIELIKKTLKNLSI